MCPLPIAEEGKSRVERSIDDDVTIITGNPVAIRELSVLVDRTRRRVSVAGDKSLPTGTALPDVATKQLDVYSSRFQSIDCPALLFFFLARRLYTRDSKSLLIFDAGQ